MLSQALLALALQLPVHDLSPGAELALELKTDQAESAGATIRSLTLIGDRAVEASTFPEGAVIEGQPSSAGLLLRGLERSTGTVVWEQGVVFGSAATPPEVEVFGAATGSLASDLYLVSGRVDGVDSLAAFDATTGSRLWVLDTTTIPELGFFGSFLIFDLEVDPSGTTIVANSSSGLVALDASSGQVLWARAGLDLAAALPSAVSALLTFSDLAVSSQRVYFNATAGLPLVAALDLATGTAVFDMGLAGSNGGVLQLDPLEQRLAVSSVNFNILFGGAVQTFVRVLDAGSGAPVASADFLQAAGELRFNSLGTELYGLQYTDGAKAGQPFANAFVWGLDLALDQLVFSQPVSPNFGADRVFTARLGIGPGGALLVAAAASQPELTPVQQPNVEVLTFSSTNGSPLGTLPIDGGAVEGPSPLMTFAADASGAVVGSRFRDTQIGSGFARTTGVDSMGMVPWTSQAVATAPTLQVTLRTAASPSGDVFYVSELLGTGIQVRALSALDGSELWRTDFIERALFNTVQFGFSGDLVATADGTRVGLVFQALGASQFGVVNGLMASLDSSTGEVQWKVLVPQLQIGSVSGMDQRTALRHDAAGDRWLLAGGAGEDLVRAFDATGAPLWSQELPTPAAGPSAGFDGIAEFELAPAADAVVIASSYVDATGGSNDFDPQVTAYRVGDGQLLWATPLADDRAQPFDFEKVAGFSIDESVGQAVVAYGRGPSQTFAIASRVAAVDLATGNPLWEVDLPDLPNALVQTRRVEHLFDGQRVLVAGSPRANGGTLGINLVAYDPLGVEAWSFALATDEPFEVTDLIPLADGTAVAVVAGPPRQASGILPLYDELGSRVLVFDAIDGTLLWQDAWSYPWGGPGDAGNLRFSQAAVVEEQLVVAGFGRLVDDAQDNDFYLSVYELPELTGDVPTLDLSDGGTQAVELRAGPEFGGHLFLTLGSVSGTAGIPLGGGLLLPITADPWTQTTLANPNLGPLVNSFGLLDPDGRASGAFVVPAGANPNLAGVEVFYASLLIDPQTLQLEGTSNPVSHLLLP